MQERDRAGLGVDLHHRHVRAERECRLRSLEVDLRAQFGQATLGFQARGEITPGDRRLRGAGHVEVALLDVEDHVLRVGLELRGG